MKAFPQLPKFVFDREGRALKQKKNVSSRPLNEMLQMFLIALVISTVFLHVAVLASYYPNPFRVTPAPKNIARSADDYDSTIIGTEDKSDRTANRKRSAYHEDRQHRDRHEDERTSRKKSSNSSALRQDPAAAHKTREVAERKPSKKSSNASSLRQEPRQKTPRHDDERTTFLKKVPPQKTRQVSESTRNKKSPEVPPAEDNRQKTRQVAERTPDKKSSNGPTPQQKNPDKTHAVREIIAEHLLQKDLQGDPKTPRETNSNTKQNQHCRPHNNTVLIKTTQSGSDILQNILYRYGDAKKRSFVLPPAGVYLGSPELFDPGHAIPPPSRGYNILANQARFHKANMAGIMPRYTKYISVVRYPPNQFERMYSYYNFDLKFNTSVVNFAKNPKRYYVREENKPRHSALNPVLYEFGLPKKMLSSADELFDKWISYIDDSFDLILIAEYMHESLILLKEMMCWSWEDVTFFASDKRKLLLRETKKQLLEWQHADYKLYKHFNRTLHEKIADYGVRRMREDVKYLKGRNEALAAACVEGTQGVKDAYGRTVMNRYVLKPEAINNITCVRMTSLESEYLPVLLHKQRNL